jgi:hypothetical protein
MHLSCLGSVIGGSQSRRSLFEKLLKAKRAGGVTQVIEHLLSKHEALNANPSTTKKKKKP